MNNEFDIWPWNYKIIVLSFSVCDRHNKLISWQFGLFEAHKKQKHMSSKLKFHHLIKTFNNMETLWVFLAEREREREKVTSALLDLEFGFVSRQPMSRFSASPCRIQAAVATSLLSGHRSGSAGLGLYYLAIQTAFLTKIANPSLTLTVIL
jgi:hypothetical protein